MIRVGLVADCACCGVRGRIEGRGLRRPCYDRARHAGTLVQWPRSTRTRAEVLEDVAALRTAGLTQQEMADRMGMKLAAFRQQLARARRAGLTV